MQELDAAHNASSIKKMPTLIEEFKIFNPIQTIAD
jgi:hypothetical protein